MAALALEASQRRVLITVMAVNFAMFGIEFSGGLIARSSAVMADSVDMLGDAIVYAVSLYALSRGARWQAGAALAKGVLILALGAGIIVEIVDKIINGVTPSGPLMLVFGSLALAANLFCLSLLWRFRKLNVNMSSTFECSRNDVMSNVGVLAAAGLVFAFASPWPDIVVAAVIAALFLHSAIKVLREAWAAWKAAAPAREIHAR